jgi:hypothetical protein
MGWRSAGVATAATGVTHNHNAQFFSAAFARWRTRRRARRALAGDTRRHRQPAGSLRRGVGQVNLRSKTKGREMKAMRTTRTWTVSLPPTSSARPRGPRRRRTGPGASSYARLCAYTSRNGAGESCNVTRLPVPRCSVFVTRLTSNGWWTRVVGDRLCASFSTRTFSFPHSPSQEASRTGSSSVHGGGRRLL